MKTKEILHRICPTSRGLKGAQARMRENDIGSLIFWRIKSVSESAKHFDAVSSHSISAHRYSAHDLLVRLDDQF